MASIASTIAIHDYGIPVPLRYLLISETVICSISTVLESHTHPSTELMHKVAIAKKNRCHLSVFNNNIQ